MLIREVSSKVAGQELSDEKNTIGKHGIIIMLPVTQLHALKGEYIAVFIYKIF